MGDTIADSVRFASLCQILFKSKEGAGREKRWALTPFINEWTVKWNDRHSNEKRDSEAARKDSLFPALRLILSNDDSRTFSMKQGKLVRYVCKAMLMTPDDAIKICMHSPEVAIETLVDQVMIRRIGAEKCELSIAEINRLLDSMKEKSDDQLNSDFQRIVKECTKQELTVVFHVMTKTIEKFAGLQRMFLLQWIHPDAYPMLLRGATLEKVCEAFTGLTPCEKSSSFNKNDILGKPFVPMLLKQMPYNSSAYEEIVKHCDSNFYSELKFDGEHILLHKLPNGEYRYFTRNQVDYSEKFGETKTQKFSFILDPFFQTSVQNCILDGELLLWDVKKNDFVRKGRKASDGNYYDAKHIDEDATYGRTTDIQRCIAVFDLLYLNGKNLMNMTLENRLSKLEKNVLAKQDKTVIFIPERTIVTHKEQLRKIYSTAMDLGEEGIVLKGMNSLYNIGSRALKNGWYKMKPDYGGHATMDLAVVAVRREKSTGFVDSLLLAVKQDSYYRIVSSVNRSTKRHLDAQLMEKLKADGGFLESSIEVPRWLSNTYRPQEHPKYETKFVREPNVQVVEVRASGLFENGSLQFPAIIAHRTDKSKEEVETYEDYIGFGRRIREQSLNAVPQPKVQKRRHAVSERYKVVKKQELDPTYDDETLKGVNVCVLEASRIDELQLFQRILLSFHAQPKPNPVRTVQFIIGTRANHPKTTTQIKTNKFTIVNGKWLRRCAEAKKILRWRESEIIHESPACTFSLKAEGDEFLFDDISDEETAEDDQDSTGEAIGEDTPPLSDVETKDNDRERSPSPLPDLENINDTQSRREKHGL